MSKSNPVPHYDFDGLSPFDVFRVLQEHDEMTPMESFFRFNAIKYLWRYKHKGGVEDLKKAQDYIGLLIKEVE